MAFRKLLPISCLEDFRDWLIKDGWTIHDNCRYSNEVVRAKKGDWWLIVYYKADDKEHYFVRDVDCNTIRRFLAQEGTANGRKN